MLTVAPDTGFKRIEEVNKQEAKYFKKQRHIGKFDFYMIGNFFFFLNLQRNTGFIEIMMWHGFIGWRKTLVLYQLQEKLLVPPRGPLMWSSLLLPTNRNVPRGRFF